MTQIDSKDEQIKYLQAEIEQAATMRAAATAEIVRAAFYEQLNRSDRIFIKTMCDRTEPYTDEQQSRIYRIYERNKQ
jgi:hypothetical protein